jgi:hypothetical protein
VETVYAIGVAVAAYEWIAAIALIIVAVFFYADISKEQDIYDAAVS